MRFITGFAISGIFVIVESWLNTMADNKSRGTLLSIYLVIIYSGLLPASSYWALPTRRVLSLCYCGSTY